MWQLPFILNVFGRPIFFSALGMKSKRVVNCKEIYKHHNFRKNINVIPDTATHHTKEQVPPTLGEYR